MPSANPHEPSPALFLHGLDSSIRGTKGQWFRHHFPEVRMRDYDGDLEQRLAQLEDQVAGLNRLILVGSSFGGLMAACFAIRHPELCRRLVLLAPALNFNGYQPPVSPLAVPVVINKLGTLDQILPARGSQINEPTRLPAEAGDQVAIAQHNGFSRVHRGYSGVPQCTDAEKTRQRNPIVTCCNITGTG